MGVKLVPTWAWLALIGGLLLACAALLERGNLHKTAFAEFRAKTAENLTRASEDARHEEQRRQKRIEEMEDEANRRTDLAVAAAADADMAAARLRARLADFVARSRGDPIAAKGGQAATDPVGVLALVLSRADERAGIVAAYADSARIAGETCVAAYEAMRLK